MKAIRFHHFGGPEVLQFDDVPEPKLRKDQVLVRVKACALNHLDLFIRKGLPGVKLPHINGSDVSGDIVEVGEYISDLKTGQRVLLAPMTYCGICQQCLEGRQNLCRQFSVLGYANDGGNCELIAVPRANVIPIPETIALTYDEAASVPLVFVTAWHMLVAVCNVKAGDVVLVLGGGSGVGSAAIQIAKMHGARVIATAGDEAKMDKSRELGADYTINHYKEKISDEVKKITAKAGVDIVFEHVGQATWDESVRSLKPGGKLVTCGATTGFEAHFDIRVLFAKQLSFLGSYMGTLGDLHSVLKHIFSGKLKPVVDKTFPLREARAAHERLEKSEQFGKIVLNP
ncbi:MAG: Alcohol dehydrogenase, zinc-binding protein [Acidobacteriales bacterium]|nr:Alcohol dehydrogenase, zinc-binding protein [Terriglobales bacterium]